jgi:hypothetical protein
MPTLLIEHSISDFSIWRAAFERYAAQRQESGVLREQIMQPIDDSHYVLVELEFSTIEAARRFRHFLETHIWSTPANSPARVGSPRARIVEVAGIDVS